ncbi:MAG: hypothetical protein WDM77_14700 [Steroidobacteraceae bacterium]
MRRLIFGLVVAAGVAAFSQSGAGAAAATHNPNDVEWTQHGGNPNEQRYSKLKQVTADNVGSWALPGLRRSPSAAATRAPRW